MSGNAQHRLTVAIPAKLALCESGGAGIPVPAPGYNRRRAAYTCPASISWRRDFPTGFQLTDPGYFGHDEFSSVASLRS